MNETVNCDRCGDYVCPVIGCSGDDVCPGCGGYTCPECGGADNNNPLTRIVTQAKKHPNQPVTLSMLACVVLAVHEQTKALEKLADVMKRMAR